MSGDSAIDKAVQKMQEAEGKVQELFDAVDKVLSWVPDMFAHLIEPIKKGCEELSKKIQEMWDKVTEFMGQRGSPSALREAREKWTSEVGKPIGKTAGDLNLDNHKTKIEWEGRAAEAYKGLVPKQVDGLNGLKSASDRMVLSLDSLANAIETFWVAVGIAIATFVIGIIAAIAACAGIVTIPAGVAVAMGVVGVVIGLIGAAITAILGAIQPINSAAAATKKEVDALGTTWGKSKSGVDLGEESNWDPQGD